MSFTIKQGDVVKVLAKEPTNSFDSAFCDPPYGLGFMGKEWDKFSDAPRRVKGTGGKEAPFAHHAVKPDNTAYQAWCTEWAKEVLRVLKPGAFLLAFGGTRTFHRLACAIEDAGFEVRDCVCWMYGSGFPKSLDISKSLDKTLGAPRKVVGKGKEAGTFGNTFKGLQHEYSMTTPASNIAKMFEGYGSCLKPAWEPVLVCMKPVEGNFAQNALKHGVSGLNIDGSRIGLTKRVPGSVSHTDSKVCYGEYGQETGFESGHNPNIGRWPANVMLDEEAAAMLDKQSGSSVSRSGGTTSRTGKGVTLHHLGEALRTGHDDQGCASRFFYTAKASSADRWSDNDHPTVKPISLTTYLAKLILPPNSKARLLVPFSGSGSELLGAKRAGWLDAMGIEIDPAYVEIAKLRLQRAGAAQDWTKEKAQKKEFTRDLFGDPIGFKK